jgi:hypothetical protein
MIMIADVLAMHVRGRGSGTRDLRGPSDDGA